MYKSTYYRKDIASFMAKHIAIHLWHLKKIKQHHITRAKTKMREKQMRYQSKQEAYTSIIVKRTVLVRLTKSSVGKM